MMQKHRITPQNTMFLRSKQVVFISKTAYYNCFTSVSIAHNPTFSHSSL